MLVFNVSAVEELSLSQFCNFIQKIKFPFNPVLAYELSNNIINSFLYSQGLLYSFL